MKALSLLLALPCLCLSSGQQWTGYLNTYPKIQSNNFNPYFPQNWGQKYRPIVPYSKHNSNGVLSPYFVPKIIPKWYKNLNGQVATKTFVGNEILRNNGIQNNSGFNGRRSFDNDIQVKQDDNKLNNFVYILNKTNDGGVPSGQTYTSMVSTSLPHGLGGRYFVDENNQNIQESLWVPPRPVWNQLPVPIPPNGLYPDDNDINWNQLDPHQTECDDLLDIVRDLRHILHKNFISKEKQQLKKLFWVIKLFIEKNNLQNSPFHVIVRQIARVLLRINEKTNVIREEDIVQILQEFKDQELASLLIELRSNPDISLAVVVSKLAQLLHRLKLVLIQKSFPEEGIKLVINRAVQWSVPLVGYYFERECKLKTQQYIVQNLEVALNLKLEGIEHVESVDELQKGWENAAGSGYIDYPVDSSDLGNSGNGWGLENQGNLGGLDSLGNQGNLGGLDGLGNQGNGGLGGLGNQANLGSLGGSGIPLDFGYPGNSDNLGGPIVQENLGGLGNQENPGVLNGYGKVVMPLSQGP